jgi:preprotein translocase subunit Sec61beta
VNLLLALLIGLFAYSVATADAAALRPRAVVLVGICVAITIAYTTRRFI